MIRVFTAVGRSLVRTIASVGIPRDRQRSSTSSPAASAPTTPTGITRAPRPWTLWDALAAPPSLTSREEKRRISTGASREIREGLPKMYSSAIRSPTTRTVLPLNRSTAALRRWGSNISGYPGQNPVHCVQEVLRHVVGLARPQRPAVLPLAEAVARQHQNRPRSRSLARDDVEDLEIGR